MEIFQEELTCRGYAGNVGGAALDARFALKGTEAGSYKLRDAVREVATASLTMDAAPLRRVAVAAARKP